MFQQFKNIFPSTSLNIRSLTESVGVNDTDWNRGVERVEALKNEFQNLNSMLLNCQESNTATSNIPTNNEINSTSVKDLKATGQMIQKLQEGWQSIHNENLENFEKSRFADSELRRLQSAGELHYSVCVQIENTSVEIKSIQNNLNDIQSSAVRLLETLTSLEHEIDSVSVDHERRELELWKKDQDRKLKDEMQVKMKALSEKETKLKQQYEEYDSIQKKRVELYEANFNAELEDYKRRRETEVSSLYSHHSNTEDTITTSLDQLQLDVDKNKDDLDMFLGRATEQTTKKVKKEKERKKSKKKSNTKPTTASIPPQHALTSSDEEDRRVEVLQDEDYEDFP
ncbi:unnamed protein product [Mucor hiemalis]